MKNSKWKVATRLLPVLTMLSGFATPAAATIGQFTVTRNASDGGAILRWNESTANIIFSLYRRADDGSTRCAGGETLTNGWCFRLIITTTPASGKREFIDRNVVLDPGSLVEYRYRINYLTGNTSTQASNWAPNCPTPADPLNDWIAQVNNYAGLWLNGDDLLTAGDIPAANGTTRFSTVTRGGDPWYFLSNDRYVALFNKSGALIGITHRLYGMQFMQQIPGQFEPLYAFNFDTRGLRMMGLSYGLSINQDVDSTSPLFDSATQQLTFTTTGFSSQLPSSAQIRMTWTLPEEGRKGLHGRIEALNMEPNAISDELLLVRFPYLGGLGNSSNSQPGLVWPADNDGYYYPQWPALPTDDPTQTGSLHSPSLSLQFFGVNLGGAQNNYWLYVGAEDPSLEPKRMFYKPYFKDSGVSHIASSYVEFYPQRGDNTDASGLAPQYDVVLTPMCASDWTPLAKHYRNWTMGNRWNNPAEPLTATKDKNIADNLKNGVFWWQSYPGWSASGSVIRTNILNTANTVKAIIGPVSASNPNGTGDNIAIHQYQWNTDGAGGNYPRYDPLESSTENLLNTFTNIQYDGTLMAPYIQVVFADISDRLMTYPANNRNGRCHRSASSATTTPYNNQRYPVDQNHGWWNSSLAYSDVKNYLIYNGALNESTGQLMNGDSDVAYYCFTSSDMDSSGPLGYGDPTTEYWQNIVLGNTATLLYLNSAGLYLDSLGSGYKPDYSSWNVNYPRSHKDGHGNWWLQGYRSIAQSVQWQAGALDGYTQDDPRYRLLPTGQRRFISTEYFNEGLMSYIDAVLNYSTPTPFNAPVVQAVYSDYQVFAGPDLRAWAQETNDDTRMLLLGRNFVWGYQLGLMQPPQLCGAQTPTCFTSTNTRSPVAVYASKLTRAHVAWKNYLQFGQYMGNADPVDGTTTTFCTQNNGCATVPAIRGSLWEGPATITTRAIVLTNTTASTQTGNIPLPITWRKGNAQICDVNNACTAMTLSQANATINVTVPGRDVRIITLPK